MSYTCLSRLTINQLILANVYLGDKCSSLNIKIKPYLMGRRNGYHILNISYTHLQFKIIIKILIKLFLSRQKILVLKDLDFYNLSISLNCKNIFFYDKK
jgi:ribosomal protein S2